MPVTLRKMTPDEFDAFRCWSVGDRARELAEGSGFSPEEARRAAAEEFRELLPDGLRTPDHFLMTIVEKAAGEPVGFIWTIHEMTDGRKQSFLCDFVIHEPKRRRGYARAALRLAEEQAAQAGCQESVLFVSDSNTPAKALYEKCGYTLLRPEDGGQYMIRRLIRPDRRP